MLKRQVNNIWISGSLLALTPALVALVGILSLDLSIRWGTVTTKSDGTIEYANTFKFRGWDAVPIQALAGLVGASGTAIAAYKASSKPAEAKPSSEETSELS